MRKETDHDLGLGKILSWISRTSISSRFRELPLLIGQRYWTPPKIIGFARSEQRNPLQRPDWLEVLGSRRRQFFAVAETQDSAEADPSEPWTYLLPANTAIADFERTRLIDGSEGVVSLRQIQQQAIWRQPLTDFKNASSCNGIAEPVNTYAIDPKRTCQGIQKAETRFSRCWRGASARRSFTGYSFGE